MEKALFCLVAVRASHEVTSATRASRSHDKELLKKISRRISIKIVVVNTESRCHHYCSCHSCRCNHSRRYALSPANRESEGVDSRRWRRRELVALNQLASANAAADVGAPASAVGWNPVWTRPEVEVRLRGWIWLSDCSLAPTRTHHCSELHPMQTSSAHRSNTRRLL